MFTQTDLRNQVITATDASEGTYDVDAIVEEIQDTYGTVDVDTLDHHEFWDIVFKHVTA
ncbi:hypothetical protein [Streptodolium elevatio]|uniref:Uncharacterized protein n=1 Tax=Streptodolium elevatio TaxID=3157996 RepID=A0ABV3DK12_9ACTN